MLDNYITETELGYRPRYEDLTNEELEIYLNHSLFPIRFRNLIPQYNSYGKIESYIKKVVVRQDKPTTNSAITLIGCVTEKELGYRPKFENVHNVNVSQNLTVEVEKNNIEVNEVSAKQSSFLITLIAIALALVIWGLRFALACVIIALPFWIGFLILGFLFG